MTLHKQIKNLISHNVNDSIPSKTITSTYYPKIYRPSKTNEYQ